MKVRKGLVASASALGLMLTSQGAGAFGMMEVGEWKVEFSGNVNGFLSDVKCEADPGGGVVLSGLACGSLVGADYDDNNVRTGLLPSWFGFHAERTEQDTKYGITIGFQPGIDSAGGGALSGGLGLNTSNFRQVFLEFSGANWGGIKIGRDLGIFGSDAILSDMTLLGVGTVSDLTLGGGNTSLGRIGVGYLYADWKGQVQYTSPKWNGLSFNVAIVDPWGLVNLSFAGDPDGTGESLDAGSFGQEGSTYGFEGKVTYGWEGDLGGKVWASFINQSLDSAVGFGDEDATGFDVGAKVTYAGFEAVGYYYEGEGIGTTAFLFDAVDALGNARDSDGSYLQLTYKLPGPGTKLGISWGESNLDPGPGDDPATSALVQTNESIVFGVYHPLTSALHLVAEYTKTESTALNGNEAEETAIAIGAILFY